MTTNLKGTDMFYRLEFTFLMILTLMFCMPCNLVVSQEKTVEKELDSQKAKLIKDDSIKVQAPMDNWKAPDQPQWIYIISNVLASEALSGLGTSTVAPPIAVDRTTGQVYIYGQGNGGVLMTSTDAGNSFVKATQSAWGFIYYSPISISPDGGRMAIFGSRGGLSQDGGKSWSVFSEGPKWGLEQACVNWQDDGRMVLAREHSCDGKEKIFLSTDGGFTWNDLGNTYSATALGILPTGTIVTQQTKDLLPVNRSEDHGKTWITQPAPKIPSTSGVERGVQFVYSIITFKGLPYWLATNGLYTTKDDGKSWTIIGNPFPDNMVGKDHFPVQGPLFGKDENHIVIMMNDQFIETIDGGVHWHSLMATPIKVPSSYACAFAGYDPISDILYFSMRHTADAHDWVQNHIYRAELKRVIKKTNDVLPNSNIVNSNKDVVLYTQPGFKGQGTIIKQCDVIISLSQILFPNGALRSIKVPEGYVVHVFQGFAGAGVDFPIEADASDLTGTPGAKMSSLMIKQKK